MGGWVGGGWVRGSNGWCVGCGWIVIFVVFVFPVVVILVFYCVISGVRRWWWWVGCGWGVDGC